MTKPRIFIGSSTESMNIAGACNVSLEHSAEVTMWPHIFELGDSTLDSLVRKANNVDFALFVFAPDDLTIMRNQHKPTVRDNVLFELGLFIGALGKKRCFILKPRGEDLYLPTDLLGINTGDFEPNRQDGDNFSAVNAACIQMTRQMNNLGLVKAEIPSIATDANAGYIPSIKESEYEISDFQLLLLAKLLDTDTCRLEGVPVWDLKNNNSDIPDFKVDIAVTRLSRIGYLERIIDSDMNGNEWYAYKITNSGIEYVLENESKIDELTTPPKQTPKQQFNELPDFDDNIPF